MKQRQLESIKTKAESGNCFCIPVDYMEYRERETRESRRQASETQREKERHRARGKENIHS